jgi:hypothetical protein
MKEIPQWQQDLVLKRLEQATLYPARLLDWDEVAKTLIPKRVKPKSGIKELRERHIPKANY